MSALPGFAGNTVTYRPPDSLAVAGESFDKIFQVSVSENAFETLDIKLLHGRTFNRFDTESTSPVGIVDERTAYMLDARGDVLGKRFQIDLENKGPLITVVGVVSTVMHGSPMVEQSSIFGTLYRPMRQLLPPWGTMTAVIASDSPDMPAEIKAAGRRVTPQIAVASIMTFQDRLALNTRQILSMVYNFLPAASLAFLMASLGIYGISTRVTMQKANNLGVMKALGARDSDVLRGFLRKTWILLGVSLAAGLVALMFSLPLVTSGSFVFGTATLAAIVLCVAVLILSMVTIASVIPVSRINRLPPQAALNYRIGV
jgi:putative ABC transport system permease protein